MTILVPENQLTQQFTVNITNMSLVPAAYAFILISQYSHQALPLGVTVIKTNARYSTLEVTFPIGFGDEHKNGIYNWRLNTSAGDTLEAGLVKIITSPGGSLGITEYISTPATEERVADVFYRPNY
tara:strand:- start:773 stop:1150 length:378 start_codon:yes stop_codon:yes gene_type:complete